MIATISIGGRQWDSDVTTSLHIAERIAIHMKNLLSITKSMHCVSPLVVLVTCAVAHAHNHIGVDTQSGLFGDPIIVKAGYLANESIFSVSAGRLMYGGAIATYQVSQQRFLLRHRSPQRRKLSVGNRLSDSALRRGGTTALGSLRRRADWVHCFSL